MKCPNCKRRDQIDTHLGDGYSQDTRECLYCGLIWTWLDGDLVVIVQGDF